MALKSAVAVGIGDELLSGTVVNSNAAMVGQLLAEAGYEVVRSICVGDVEEQIADVLADASGLAGLVIATGGLGPTQDDRTREALARLLGTKLETHDEITDEIRRRFESFGRQMPISNIRQAQVPRGAEPIPNPWGTAPGLRAQWRNATIYVVPGVPMEARRMLTEAIIPTLTKSAAAKVLELKCIGIAESELADRLSDLADLDDPKMAFLPGRGEVKLRFVSHNADLAHAESVVRSRCGDAVYSSDGRTLERVVAELLLVNGKTIATAESCTAGMLSARLASVPGASNWFRGGIAAYATDIKSSFLKVPADLLDEPVSEPVAAAMAEGACHEFGADFGVSITCSAGPDPQGGAGVGTVVLGLATRDETTTRSLNFPGDREQIRMFATTFALNLLRLHLL